MIGHQCVLDAEGPKPEKRENCKFPQEWIVVD